MMTNPNLTRRTLLGSIPATTLATAIPLPADASEETEMAATWERLRQFCLWTGETLPATIVDADGAPTFEFLTFAKRTGLSLDWVFMGDVRPLLMGSYRQATSPVMAMYRQWQSMLAAEGAEGLSEDEVEDMVAARCRFEEQMFAVPSQAPGDVWAKIATYSSFGECTLPDRKQRPEFWAEAQAMLGGAV